MQPNQCSAAGSFPRQRPSMWKRAYPFCLSMMLFAICDAGCKPSENASPLNDSQRTKSDLLDFAYQGRVVTASTVDAKQLDQWKDEGWNAIAIELVDGADHDQLINAAQLVKDHELQLDYYIEVARSPQLADSQPQLMASLQGHDEWRRLFPELPELSSGQVVKTWPWVPIVYRESYEAQLSRVKALMSKLPEADRIWLHDLQGGPSCCGCGHPLCRWTGDYGPIHTADPLGDDAAASFVSDIQKQFPAAQIVPVWATECEAEDQHEMCGGVGCYDGICWKAWNKQLTPLAESTELLGVSCFYKEYQRDLPRYDTTAGWVRFAIQSFESMTRKHEAKAIPSDRLVAVLQGWDVSDNEIAAQIKEAQASRAKGILLVDTEQDQSWLPKTFDVEELLQKEPRE